MVLDSVDQLKLRSTILDGEIVTLDVFLMGRLPNQVNPDIGFHWTN
jgi:ATP-dependent DNA ligase